MIIDSRIICPEPFESKRFIIKYREWSPHPPILGALGASTPFHQVLNKHFSVFATERQDDLSLLDTNPTEILYYREGLNNVLGLGLDLETMWSLRYTWGFCICIFSYFYDIGEMF